MPSAAKIYMVDCFFPEARRLDGFRRESFSVVASSDDEAIREAETAALSKKPDHFHVRSVTSKGDQVFYRSQDA